METLESLRQRTMVVTEDPNVYHWRAPGTATMCGKDYSYLKLPLQALPEVENTHNLCERCSEVVGKIERGW